MLRRDTWTREPSGDPEADAGPGTLEAVHHVSDVEAALSQSYLFESHKYYNKENKPWLYKFVLRIGGSSPL